MAITKITNGRRSAIETSILDMDNKGSLCLHIENRRAGTGTVVIMQEDEMLRYINDIMVAVKAHADRRASERGQMSRGQIRKEG